MKKETDNVKLDIKIPKKRGRKPKNLDLLTVENETNKKIPKKRGRKPKNYVPPVEEEVKIPKKRGRKPMMSQVTTNNKNISENFLTRDNVLHFKINSNEINNNILLETLYKYNPDINDPEPYDPHNMSLKSLDSKEEEGNKKYDVNNYSTQKKEEIEEVKPFMVSEPIENSKIEIDDNDISYNNILNCENLSTDNSISQKIVTKNRNNNKRRTNTIMIYYNEYNKRKEWPKNSSINCFWCCHTFNNIPCALPTKIKNEVFYVFGNFCSKECAAAYNFESGDNSNNIWERYTLLNYFIRFFYLSFLNLKHHQ